MSKRCNRRNPLVCVAHHNNEQEVDAEVQQWTHDESRNDYSCGHKNCSTIKCTRGALTLLTLGKMCVESAPVVTPLGTSSCTDSGEQRIDTRRMPPTTLKDVSPPAKLQVVMKAKETIYSICYLPVITKGCLRSIVFNVQRQYLRTSLTFNKKSWCRTPAFWDATMRI